MMNHRERFRALMNYEPIDRMPLYYFGTWYETKVRWAEEGLTGFEVADRSLGPQLPEMDPDWEQGMWGAHGLVRTGPISGRKEEVLEEDDDSVVVRTSLGAIQRRSKGGSTIPEHIEEALKPTRAAWRKFKRMLDPSDSRRRPQGWETAASRLNEGETTRAFLAGSLYAWPREWLGVEAISYLAYDDPALYEEIIETVADHFMELLGPVLDRVTFDLAYFFEDCCFRNGPLFSPDCYRRYYHGHYRRMVDFYHRKGVKRALLDSDGKTDALIPCWLESGLDIVFPIEVGTWRADPVELRQRFGKQLRMMGGVDKHVITQGEDAVRAHLQRLVPLVREGGYIPLPDHRIPPDCSLQQFRDYVRIFREVLG